MGQVRIEEQTEAGTWRFVTRRAAAVGVDRTGKLEENVPLTGYRIERAVVHCTMADIGDPRFRLWLVEGLGSRMTTRGGITLELHA